MMLTTSSWVDLSMLILIGCNDDRHYHYSTFSQISTRLVWSNLKIVHSSFIGRKVFSSCCWGWRKVSVKLMTIARAIAWSVMISSCFAKYEITFRWLIFIHPSLGRLSTFGIGSLGRHCVDHPSISLTILELTLMFAGLKFLMNRPLEEFSLD